MGRKPNWQTLKVELQRDCIAIEWEQYRGAPPDEVIAMGRELRNIGAMSTMDDPWGWWLPTDRWPEAEQIIRRYAGDSFRRVGFECDIAKHRELEHKLAVGELPF